MCCESLMGVENLNGLRNFNKMKLRKSRLQTNDDIKLRKDFFF